MNTNIALASLISLFSIGLWLWGKDAATRAANLQLLAGDLREELATERQRCHALELQRDRFIAEGTVLVAHCAHLEQHNAALEAGVSHRRHVLAGSMLTRHTGIVDTERKLLIAEGSALP